MQKPVGEIRRQSRRPRCFAHRINSSGSVCIQLIASLPDSTRRRMVFSASTSSTTREPLFECSALISPAIVIVGRSIVGQIPQDERLAIAADTASRPRRSRRTSRPSVRIRSAAPTQWCRTVLRLVLKRIPITLRGISSPDILRDQQQPRAAAFSQNPTPQSCHRRVSTAPETCRSSWT